jgi:DNA-binding CsgD family transcriptional regulator
VLLERDRELARIDESLRAASSGTGSLAIIEAAAGLGKTQLLREAERRARAAGMEVVTAQGSELEGESPFGVLRQALGKPVATATPQEREDLLQGPARLAASLLLGSEDQATSPGPPGADLVPALLHSLYWLLVNLAERRPLLITLDDAHWADAPSLRFVHFVMTPLAELPVSILMALRPTEGHALHSGAGLAAQIAAEPTAGLISLQPLSRDAVAQLVESEFGPGIPDDFSQAVHRATLGNPFFVGELLREIAREQIPRTSEGAQRVLDLVPSNVARAVIMHLGRLAPHAPEVAKATAILGGRAEPRHVRALSGLDEDEAGAAADAMIRASILLDDGRLSFSHPIVRGAVIADMGAHETAQAHRRAAEILRREQSDATLVAAHLLNAAPAADANALETLRAAAKLAMERGAPDAAAVYLRRAELEPPPRSERAHLALELGRAEAFAGEPTAKQTLSQALELSEDPGTRGQAALALAQSALIDGDIERVIELAQVAIAELAPVNPQLALITRAELVNARLFRAATAPQAHVDAQALQADAKRLGPPGSRHASACLASLRAMQGAPVDEVVHLANDALANGELLASVGAESAVAHLPSLALAFVEQFDLALAAADATFADARRRGSPLGFVNASCFRSHLYYRTGQLREAEADARAALEMTIELPRGLTLLVTRAFYADVLLEQGQAEAALEAVAGFSPPPESGGALNHILHTRGRVLVALGRPAEALDDLRACGAGNDGIGAVNPGTIPWRSAAAEALLALGDESGARQLAQEELEQARRYGGPRAIGIALIACGRAESGERRLSVLREAETALRDSPARLEHARALCELGASLRRANQRQAAREPLMEGLELARGCGALALATRAGEELRATGARPRRLSYSGVDSLTASELRVARMAREGKSNPEIAQELFVTRKTIEAHLSSVYSKLNVRSRRELPSALSGAGG